MSTKRKTKKLFLHPILFFKDRNRKIIERQQVIDSLIMKSPKINNPSRVSMVSAIKGLINTLPVSNIDLKHYEVAVYFFGSMGNLYQIEQWFAPLKVLNETKRILLIVRNREVYNWLNKNSDFTTAFCKTIDDLTYIYESNNIKCVLYVNHGFKNFQSLIIGDALHVHINHGESDKISTVSNQCKAYDYTFIVGDAAYDKYKFNLIKKDMDKFVPIGRPQLDHVEKIPALLDTKADSYREASIDKKVILYAPTWEGTHESMNFTSLNEYGMSIVQQILNHPNYYLVYKPHPNTGSKNSHCKDINKAIIQLINDHENGLVVSSGDINSLYEHVDLAIFDNSAVAIDYLQIDKPMIMSDMFHRIRGEYTKPAIVGAARMISTIDSYSISKIIEEELTKDTKKEERNKIRQYFLGDFDYTKQESTKVFVSKIHEIIDERDMLVRDLEKIKTNI